MQTILPIYVFDDKYAADTDGFTFDLAAWLGDTDQLSGIPTATVTPASATLNTVVTDGALVTVWVGSGVAGVAYTIELHVATTGGRNCRIRGQFSVED